MPENLPKHHIDTSVLIEPQRTEEGRQCKKYLQKLNYNYSGILSFPVLSELFLFMQAFEDFNDRYDFIEPILWEIKLRRITFYSPVDIGDILNKIKITDNRIDPLDREILASASEDKVHALITLDRNMINNKKVENLLGIRILHPRDLL